MMVKESPMTFGKMVAQKNDDGGRAERLQICDSFEKFITFRECEVFHSNVLYQITYYDDVLLSLLVTC